MMVGVGPFVTIPLLLKEMNGPQAMLTWIVGAIVAACDALVWSELAAAFPGSGGTYHFFDVVYGERGIGRALKFLFVWQFLISGPLEMASGMLGFSAYASSIWPSLKLPVLAVGLGRWPLWTITRGHFLAALTMIGLIVLAYRRIEAAGKLMIVLWSGMLATVVWVIAAAWIHADPSIPLDVPPGALELNADHLRGMGLALGLAMYAYFGYYQVCYLGDEVTNPAKVIPRSMSIAIVAVASIYMLMNFGILKAIPWREAMDSQHIASDLIARYDGMGWSHFLSLMVMWTAVAACFAALLGYSRVPYAASVSGHFFRTFAATHPRGDFPHRSLLLMGGIAVVACLADLETVIAALLTTRILIQFIAQICTVIYLRTRPELFAKMPFRMPLYPLPAIVAFVGWSWVFGTTSKLALIIGLASLAAGIVAFVAWDRLRDRALINEA